MLVPEVVAATEESIRQQVRELPDPLRAEFHRRFKQRYRDPDTYAGLNFLLVAGLHHFYLGRTIRGAFNLGLFLAGAFLCFSPLILLGVALILGIFVIELPALFRAQLIVQHYNNNQMKEVLAELHTSPVSTSS